MTVPSSIRSDLPPVFSCQLTDANILSIVLKALNANATHSSTDVIEIFQICLKVMFQIGTLSVSQDGIKLITDHARILQCHAYLPRSLFQTFSFTPPHIAAHSDTQSTSWDPDSSIARQNNTETDEERPSVVCAVHFSTLLECLNVFGSSSTHQKSKTAVKMEVWS